MSRVTELPAADPIGARAHFEALLAFETDCWDVHASLGSDAQDDAARRRTTVARRC